MNRNIDSENDDTTGHMATTGPIDEAAERRVDEADTEADTEGHRLRDLVADRRIDEADTEGHTYRR